MLRAMLGDDLKDDEDSVLVAYLELAEQKILNRMYPFTDNYEGLSVPDRYVAAQLNIAAYKLSRRGTEGQIQHIENGIHRNFGAADVPDGMLAEIVPYCKVLS